MTAPHAEPRPAPRQRDDELPQVDVVHSAAGEELAITVHLHVPTDYNVPSGLKENVASAVQSIVLPFEAAVEEA